jgi:hypothetical protein
LIVGGKESIMGHVVPFVGKREKKPATAPEEPPPFLNMSKDFLDLSLDRLERLLEAEAEKPPSEGDES